MVKLYGVYIVGLHVAGGRAQLIRQFHCRTDQPESQRPPIPRVAKPGGPRGQAKQRKDLQLKNQHPGGQANSQAKKPKGCQTKRRNPLKLQLVNQEIQRGIRSRLLREYYVLYIP